MTALAAAATGHGLSTLTIVLVALAALAAWLVSLLLWPYGPCGWCNGTGKNWGSNGKRHGRCRSCDGSGRKLRLAARLLHRATIRK